MTQTSISPTTNHGTEAAVSRFKDGVPENTHPLNIAQNASEAGVDRIPLFEVYMRMAEELAKRSTCSRLHVGTVITDARLENVLAIGYNGNAKSLPNRCDSSVPGNCGCIHSEINALVKAPGATHNRFITPTTNKSPSNSRRDCRRSERPSRWRHRSRSATTATETRLARGGWPTTRNANQATAWFSATSKASKLRSRR